MNLYRRRDSAGRFYSEGNRIASRMRVGRLRDGQMGIRPWIPQQWSECGSVSL